MFMPACRQKKWVWLIDVRYVAKAAHPIWYTIQIGVFNTAPRTTNSCTRNLRWDVRWRMDMTVIRMQSLSESTVFSRANSYCKHPQILRKHESSLHSPFKSITTNDLTPVSKTKRPMKFIGRVYNTFSCQLILGLDIIHSITLFPASRLRAALSFNPFHSF